MRLRSVAGFFVTASLLAFLPACSTAGTIVRDGRVSGCIIIPDKTCEGKVLTAANDLSSYILQMSGARVPVIRDSEPFAGFYISIGSTRLAPVEADEITEEKVGYDGYLIRSVPGGMVIAGRNDAGTANGVYHFAETALGVYWFSPEDEGPSCPKRSTVEIPSINLTVKPDFEWRCQYQSWMDANYLKGDPRAKEFYKNRDRWWNFNRAYGINAGVGHAFQAMVPAALFEDHPEYFPFIDYTFDGKGNMVKAGPDGSLGSTWPWKSGRHAADGYATQRCFSNPDVLKRAIEWTAGQFDKNPDLRFASLSANDGPWWCNCDGCKAMGPTRAHQNLAFANAVAKANEEKYPDRGYFMLAYMNTIEPPADMKAHPAIVPIIAPLWQCRVHPISSDCPDMVYLRRVLREWSKIANGRIGGYYYITPGPFTFPGPIALAEELRFVKGLGGKYWLRENQSAPAVNWAMLNWMEARLLWDTNMDPVKLRRQFIEGYYGPAAAASIEKVYDAIETGMRTGVADREWAKDDGTGLHSLNGNELLGSIISKCRGDIEEALKIAPSEQEPFRSRIVRDMEMLMGQ